MDPKTAQSLNDFFASAGVVAGVASLVAAVSFAIVCRAGLPICPRWTPSGVPWKSASILLSVFPVAFLGYQFAVGVLYGAIENGILPSFVKTTTDDPKATEQLRQLWARVLVTPALVGVYVLVVRFLLAGSGYLRLARLGIVARNTLLGVCGWAVLMPLTFAVHFLTLQVLVALGIPEQQHPVMALRPQDDGTGGILFGFAICACTPLIEECLFRGLLVPWAGQRRFAPWVLMVAAFVLAGFQSQHPIPPVAFIAVLCLPLLLLQTVAPPKRFPRRTLSCILASSAVFAAVHSSVWPTPIPLFFLACGLGFLTARSRSIVPAVVAHGLFNAVSFVMLCRGTTL